MLIYSIYVRRFNVFSTEVYWPQIQEFRQERNSDKGGSVVSQRWVGISEPGQIYWATLLRAAKVQTELLWKVGRGQHTTIQLCIRSGGGRQGRMCHCFKSTQMVHFLTPFSCAVELTLAVSCSVGGTWELKQMSWFPGLLSQRGEPHGLPVLHRDFSSLGIRSWVPYRRRGGSRDEGKTDAPSHPSQMQKETGQKVSVWIWHRLTAWHR